MAHVTTQTAVRSSLPADTPIAFEVIGGDGYQGVKIGFGPGGAVTLVSAADGLPVNVVAGTVTINQDAPIPASPSAAGIYWGTTLLPIKPRKIAANLSGDNEVIPAVPGAILLIVRFSFVAAAPVTATFKSGPTTQVTGPMSFAANGGMGGAYCPVGHLQTAVGEAFVVNLSGAVMLAGFLNYIEVPGA